MSRFRQNSRLHQACDRPAVVCDCKLHYGASIQLQNTALDISGRQQRDKPFQKWQVPDEHDGAPLMSDQPSDLTDIVIGGQPRCAQRPSVEARGEDVGCLLSPQFAAVQDLVDVHSDAGRPGRHSGHFRATGIGQAAFRIFALGLRLTVPHQIQATRR